jgi:hypothetical protein
MKILWETVEKLMVKNIDKIFSDLFPWF